jgi:hypothetical protein
LPEEVLWMLARGGQAKVMRERHIAPDDGLDAGLRAAS